MIYNTNYNKYESSLIAVHPMNKKLKIYEGNNFRRKYGKQINL